MVAIRRPEVLEVGAITTGRRHARIRACILAVGLAVAACAGGMPTTTPGSLRSSPLGGLPTFLPILGGPSASAAAATTPAMRLPGSSNAPPVDASPATPPGAPASAWPSVRVPQAADNGYGPPSWVTTGTRLTWYGATASIAESYYTYVEDENGDWVDPVTHKRYRRTDNDPGGMPTAASQAYTQTDVLALDGNDVVISTTLYSIDLLANQLTLTPIGGAKSAGAIVEGAWINPALLQQVLATGYQGLQILRGPYVLGGTTFDAISFVSTESGYQSSTYDTKSGVLLSTNTNSQGAGSPVHGPLDNPQGNVQITLTRLVSVRNRTIPGMAQAAPGWVAGSPTLMYTGQDVIVNPMDPAARFAYPVQAAVQLSPGGATWASFTSRTVIDLGGYQQPADSAGVTGSTGTYWYDPATLAGFVAGQVIDEDPVTGARAYVEAVDQGPFGRTVRITTEMNGVTVRLDYDVGCGVLVAMDIAQSVTGSTLQLQLNGLPDGG